MVFATTDTFSNCSALVAKAIASAGVLADFGESSLRDGRISTIGTLNIDPDSLCKN